MVPIHSIFLGAVGVSASWEAGWSELAVEFGRRLVSRRRHDEHSATVGRDKRTDRAEEAGTRGNGGIWSVIVVWMVWTDKKFWWSKSSKVFGGYRPTQNAKGGTSANGPITGASSSLPHVFHTSSPRTHLLSDDADRTTGQTGRHATVQGGLKTTWIDRWWGDLGDSTS